MLCYSPNGFSRIVWWSTDYILKGRGPRRLVDALCTFNVRHKYTTLNTLQSFSMQIFEKFPSKHSKLSQVVFRLVWRRDVGQCQTNVEITLCTSTLKFTTLNKDWNWATSKQGCYFQRRISYRWSTSKQRCEYDHLQKIEKRKKYFWTS